MQGNPNAGSVAEFSL